MRTYVLKGKTGSWLIIGKTKQDGNMYYLMENLIYRDMVPQVIVDAQLNIIVENTWDGFLALEDNFITNK